MKYLTVLLLTIGTASSCSERNGSDKKKSEQQTVTERLEARADSSYQNDDFDAALGIFNRLIELDSSNGEYFYKRGVSYFSTNNFKNSVYDFNKSLSLKYREADAYYMLGLCAMASSDLPEAIMYFEKCLILDSNNKQAIESLTACRKRVKSKS